MSTWYCIALHGQPMVRLMFEDAVGKCEINPAHLEIRDNLGDPEQKCLWMQFDSDPGDGQCTIMLRMEAVERWSTYFDGFVRGFRSAENHFNTSLGDA